MGISGIHHQRSNNMTFEVELNMFQDGAIRRVVVPTKELTGRVMEDLGLIFYYGQNYFQNDPGNCSVSAGDVIRYKGTRYLVKSIGFKKLENGGVIEGTPKERVRQIYEIE